MNVGTMGSAMSALGTAGMSNGPGAAAGGQMGGQSPASVPGGGDQVSLSREAMAMQQANARGATQGSEAGRQGESGRSGDAEALMAALSEGGGGEFAAELGQAMGGGGMEGMVGGGEAAAMALAQASGGGMPQGMTGTSGGQAAEGTASSSSAGETASLGNNLDYTV